jgi:hypothetical protein
MALVDGKVIVDMDIKGEMSGKSYTGKFVMKLFLTLKQRNEVAVEYSKRDMGNAKDPTQSTINMLICELQARCDECPAWFKGDKAWEMIDVQPILELKRELDNAYDEHMKAISE